MNNTKHITAASRLLRTAAQVCLVALLAIPTTVALAAQIVVTDFDDVIDDNDGSCTLREAIRSVNGGVPIDGCLLDDTVNTDLTDLIVLTAGTYSVDLSNGTGEDASLDGDLDITSTVEIRGIASDYTVIDGDAATSQERVFDIGAGLIEVLLRDLTVTGGHQPTDNGGNIRSQAGDGSSMGGGAALAKVVIRDGRALSGAGIHAAGSLTTFRSTVENNETVGDDGVGGGIAYVGGLLAVIESDIQNNRAATGAGIYNNGQTFTVTGSRVRGNIAAGGAGADSGRGGGIATFGAAAIAVSRTLIENNQAEQGGGLYLAGAGGEVTHSAIINNSASSEGGGVYSAEDGFVRHSTLSGNDAPSGGGVYSASPTQMLLDAVTLAGNSGGGLFNQSGAVLESTLVADNAGGNCLGTAPSAGVYNLDDGNSCGFPTDDDNTPSFVMTDPLLGPLQDNGGGLPTLALLAGSPAIDAISSDLRMNCQNPPDQRGYPRGYPPILATVMGEDDEYRCDIGAFEQHAPYVVNSTADTPNDDIKDGLCADASGACTLRAAIMQANTIPGLEEIELGNGTYAITLAGAGEDQAETGDLDIRDYVIIRGQGPEQTIIDAAQLDRAFHIQGPPTSPEDLTPAFSKLTDLSIRQGAADEGGGILASEPLTLERTVLQDNSADTGNGGAILCSLDCELKVIDSTLRSNRAPIGRGGAIYHNRPLEGGAPELLLDRSTLSGNSADTGGAVEVTNSLRAVNTTFSGNSASASSGAFLATRATINSSTIFDNQADRDAGGFVVLEPSVLSNSIVAGNRFLTAPDNCAFNSGALVSTGFNLSDTDSADCNLTEPTDLPDTDPLLGALADNDGAVQTHAPMAGSPAIDAGDEDRCPATDPRGFTRPDDGDGDGSARCDIGAYEVLGADLAVTISASPEPVQEGSDITYTVTADNAGQGDADDVVVTVTLPASLSFVSASAGSVDCTIPSDEVSCELGDIAAGTSTQASVVATADQAGSVSVSASITSGTGDAMPDNNTASVTTTVNAPGGSGGGGSTGGGGGGGGGPVDPLWLALLTLTIAYRFGLIWRAAEPRRLTQTRTLPLDVEAAAMKSSTTLFLTMLLVLGLSACGGGGGSVDDGGGGSVGGGGRSVTSFTVSTDVGAGGAISPASATVDSGNTTSFTITLDSGFIIDSVSGCDGSLSGTTYTTEAIIADCTVSASFSGPPATAAVPDLTFRSVKTFRFSWTDVSDATHYKLLENPDSSSGFTQVASDIPQGSQSIDHVVPLYARLNAQYILQSCNAVGCNDSASVAVSGTLVDSIGYVKASNTGASDFFGGAVSLSGDGNTLAVGARGEDSNATGINTGEDDDTADESGAVYVFTRSGSSWSQQAYLKASNTDAGDEFGGAVSLSEDGDTLAVGTQFESSDSGAVYMFTRSGNSWSHSAYIKASNTGAIDFFGGAVSLSSDGSTLAVAAPGEDSNATGINTGEDDDTAVESGAVYVFTRSGDSWNQQAYIKASNTEAGDLFGTSVALSADGSTLAVGARGEDSNATGINTGEDDDTADESGAVYVFVRATIVGTVGTDSIVTDPWRQEAYIKASNTDEGDQFGGAVSLNGNGSTLAVGAHFEASNATGIDIGEGDDSEEAAGAVYVFTRLSTGLGGGDWSQQAYVKASNTDDSDQFGISVSLSESGDALAVGAQWESSNATGVDGDESDNSADQSGAAYLFTRSGGSWSQQAYVKASNTDEGDQFGHAVSLSGDGNTLAVGAHFEASNATGIDIGEGDDSASGSGAVYLY